MSSGRGAALRQVIFKDTVPICTSYSGLVGKKKVPHFLRTHSNDPANGLNLKFRPLAIYGCRGALAAKFIGVLHVTIVRAELVIGVPILLHWALSDSNTSISPNLIHIANLGFGMRRISKPDRPCGGPYSL